MVIDLQEPLAELFSEFEIDAQDGVSYTGRRYRTISRVSEIVRIQRDRMIAGEDLARDLMTMQSHLAHGFSVMFSADADKAYAANLNLPVKAGDTVLNVGPNLFRSLVGNQIVAADDYLMIESENPAMVYQQVEIESITATATSGGNITLKTPIQFDFNSGKVGVRYYRFWPTLKRPVENINTNMITNERGFLWSLDVLLTPDYGQYSDYLIGVGNDLGDLTDGIATFDENDPPDSSLALSGFVLFDTGINTDGPPITEPEIDLDVEWQSS